MSLFSASLRKSLADVMRRKGRSLLVIAGVFISVSGLTAINTTEQTILSSFAYAAGYHSAQPDITLNVDRLDPALLPTLQAAPNVAAIQYQAIYRTLWDTQSAAGQVPLAIQSYPDLAHVPLDPFHLTQGRYPGVGEILLDYADQQVRRFQIGDTITVEAEQGTARLRVVGITSTAGFTGGDSTLGYMSAAGLARIAGVTGVSTAPNMKPAIPSLLNVINVKARDAGEKNATQAALIQMLTARHITVYYATQPGANANAALIEKTIDGLFSLLRVLASLAVVMSGLLILGTVTTLITEQTAIIGVMKAMGGSWGAIARGYLLTVAIMCFPATLLGVGLGLGSGYELASALAPRIPLALLPFAADPALIALSLAVGFGVPILAALIPIWNGVRVTAHDALSGYGVRVGAERARLAPIGERLTWVSQVILLGARGAFRKRWRAALTLITLTVAGACFLVVQVAVTSLDQTVTASVANSSADLTVRFHDPATFGKISDRLAALPNVKRIESTASGNITTGWGTLAIAGYEPDTQIYHYQLTSGRWLREGDANVILLSDDAARKTGLSVGDTLTVGGRALTVIGTVHQTISVLGWVGAAIMPIATADALTSSPASGEGPSEIVIEASDRSLAAVNQLAARVNATVNPAGSSSDGQGYYSGDGGTVDTTHEYATRRQGTWYVLYYLLYGVALLVGMSGAVALADTLISSVVDRQREIGILRAMGASSGQVARIFWVEGVALGSMAWLLGAVVGAPLAFAFVQVIWQVAMPLDFHLDPVAFAVMLAAILCVASLASVAPSWRATHTRTAEMLRYE